MTAPEDFSTQAALFATLQRAAATRDLHSLYRCFWSSTAGRPFEEFAAELEPVLDDLQSITDAIIVGTSAGDQNEVIVELHGWRKRTLTMVAIPDGTWRIRRM